MNKNIIVSMTIVFFSTLFLLIFLSGGLFVLDKFARASSVEAQTIEFKRPSINHSYVNKIARFKDEKTSLQVYRLNKVDDITIAFAGDVMMQGSIEKAMKKKGIDYPFLQVKKELQEADIAIVNLETAVTTRETAYSKQYNFKTGPQSLQALQNAGFDLVSLANNHTMDYKEVGLVDTINHLKNVGLSFVGAGRNSDEAYSAQVFNVKDRSIAILGFSRILPTVNWYAGTSKPGIASGYQLERMLRIIEETKLEVDYLFVFMHWGVERTLFPEPYQTQYAKAMIDAGSDGIIGSHPHVIQGLDYYKGKPIAYSLGNFLFPSYVSDLTAESAVLTLIIRDGEIIMKFSPYEIKGDQVAKVSHEVNEARLQRLEELSFNVRREDSIFFPKN